MVPSLLRHRDKDICTGGTADAVANWGEEAAGGGGRRVHHLEDQSFGVKEQRKGSI